MPNGSRTPTSRRALRYRLTLLLQQSTRPLCISEMVRHLEAAGWPAPDPPHKSVADSLRWEIRRGRVVRVSRGHYAAGRVDRRTAWWIRRQLDIWESVERVSESPPVSTPPEPSPLPTPNNASIPPWLTELRPHLAQ